MADEQLRLPRSSYDELTKIIKAYGECDEPADLAEISKITGMSPTVISGNARFLIRVDILQPGKKKQATPKGQALARALDHGIEEEVQKQWRLVVDDSDFLSRLLTSIRIRGGMDEATLTSHIAYTAGEARSPVVMTGARTVAEILRIAGLTEERDGKVVVMSGVGRPPDREAATKVPPSVAAAIHTTTVEAAASTGGNAGAQIGIQVRIQLQVSCGPNELDGLGEKIRSVVEAIIAAPAGAAGEADSGSS